MMRQKWGEMQFVEISMDEIFCLQDKLDMVKDNPEEVWKIFDDFLMECENQLELSDELIKELNTIEEEDFIPFDDELVKDYDLNNIEVFNDDNDDVRFKEDVPFYPRHNF